MPNEIIPSNILDLTHPQTLFELAVEDHELRGHCGAKLIADLKERAFEAEYTHMYYRDPMRPGLIWFVTLGDAGSLPSRGQLDQCRAVTESVFPGFLEKIKRIDEEEIGGDTVMSQIPPLVQGVSGTHLATALEYLVFAYPTMVRAWAALIFTYGEMLNLSDAAETVRRECVAACPYAQVVAYLSGIEAIEA